MSYYECIVVPMTDSARKEGVVTFSTPFSGGMRTVKLKEKCRLHKSEIKAIKGMKEQSIEEPDNSVEAIMKKERITQKEARAVKEQMERSGFNPKVVKFVPRYHVEVKRKLS